MVCGAWPGTASSREEECDYADEEMPPCITGCSPCVSSRCTAFEARCSSSIKPVAVYEED